MVFRFIPFMRLQTAVALNNAASRYGTLDSLFLCWLKQSLTLRVDCVCESVAQLWLPSLLYISYVLHAMVIPYEGTHYGRLVH